MPHYIEVLNQYQERRIQFNDEDALFGDVWAYIAKSTWLSMFFIMWGQLVQRKVSKKKELVQREACHVHSNGSLCFLYTHYHQGRHHSLLHLLLSSTIYILWQMFGTLCPNALIKGAGWPKFSFFFLLFFGPCFLGKNA